MPSIEFFMLYNIPRQVLREPPQLLLDPPLFRAMPSDTILLLRIDPYFEGVIVAHIVSFFFH